MSDAPSGIKELVETFDQHIESYRSQQYNETQLRREFLDPFFIALGWDVTNSAGYAHAYKDVIHEDAIKIGGATKAPDYCFRIGGVRKFFLEAKKPSINIKDDPHPAYQLRRYAWSAKLPLSILTDFEEFAVYDCQIRPKQQDKSDTARIMYFTYKDYLDKWDKIADIFAREAILKGSFDKYAASTKSKRGTTTVDVEFLNEIEKWRDMLAKIIARRNQLSTSEINFCVQRTIDRILFLRMCEDRGIEPYGQLKALSSGERNYKRLCELFEKADQRYNSGLFHFHDEKERHESPDTLSPNIEIDDKDLKWILHNLYYPQSPYEFSVLPAEILGNVYEQFLGKVIRLTSPNQAKVEDKPEVKKAGGVYYTPSYIVDYIVKNTVGKLIGAPVIANKPLVLGTAEGEAKQSLSGHCEEAEGRRGNLKPLTPRQIANIKILDPACGSGSFLLGAYTFLLDYHRDWYVANDPKKYTKQLYQGKAGQWFLNIAEKKKILLNNIYGVDIDSQAVEVTKLSLLLKVLEGEDSQTLENQYRLFHERVLPDLADNIKCGNSLIGPDFFENAVIAKESSGDDCGSQDGLRHNLDLHNKINPFDWKAEFPQVFSNKNSGFDAVIGNPPYIRVQNLDYSSIDYLKNKFVSAYKRLDISICFIEIAINLLKNEGLAGYITSVQFFTTEYGEKIRELLSKINLNTIVDFSGAKVFSKATTYTGILILSKDAHTKTDVYNNINIIESLSLDNMLINATKYVVKKELLGKEIWNFSNSQFDDLLKKIKSETMPLKEVATPHTGLFTGLNDVLLLTESDLKSLQLEYDIVKPICMGKDPIRYGIPTPSHYVIYPYVKAGKRTVILDEKTLKQKYPKCYDYLLSNKKRLIERKDSRKKVSDMRSWYSLTRFSNIDIIESEKIITPGEVRINKFCIDSSKSAFYCARVFAIVPKNINIKFILGCLNSKLLNIWFHKNCSLKQGGYYSYNANVLKEVPIKIIDFNNPDDKSMHDKLVNLVEQILDLHKRLSAAKIPSDKTKIQRQIDATDKQIDTLVYKLYNLTDEEIKIVEGDGVTMTGGSNE